MHKERKFPFFSIVLTLLILGIAAPVYTGKIPLAGRYLVQQFAPWANDRRSGVESNLSHKPVGSDDLQLFYPNRLFTTATLLRGELPLWNPYILSGAPHLGQSETAVLYPLFFLTLIIPQYAAWALFVLSEPVLASIGMYLFLKRLLRDSRASALGAVTFGFSGVILVRMVEGLSVGHTLLWAPYVLWGVESFITLRKPKYLALTLLALTLSVFAGWLQYTFYIFVLGIAYVVVRRSRLLTYVPFLLLPIAALPHIYPALQLFLSSPRYLSGGAQEVLIHLMPPTHILAILVPDLWGNPGTYTFFGTSAYKDSIVWIPAIPFIFSLMAIVKNTKLPVVRFFIVTAVLTLILGIQNPISSLIITGKIPLISTFLPNRIFAVTIISLSVLAGYGFLQVLQNPQAVKRVLLRITIALLLLLTCIGIASIVIYTQTPEITIGSLPRQAILGIRLRSLIFPFGSVFAFGILTLFLMNNKRITLLVISVFLLTGVQQVSFARKYQEWSEVKYVYPSHSVFTFLQKHAGFDRVIGVGGAHITSDISEVYGLYSAEGIAPNYPLQYAQFADAALSGPYGIGNVGRVEVRIAPTQQNVFIDKNPILLKLLSVTGTRYIVVWDGDEDNVPDDKVDHTLFRLVLKDGLWRVYEYTKALPRAFLTTDFQILSADQVLPRVFDVSTRPSQIILDTAPGVQNNPAASGTANINKITANSMIVSTTSDLPMVLFTSDTYWGDFNGFVDGKKTPILPADYAYRAVVVPAGTHTVEFAYDMSKEKIAFGAASIVWLGVVGILIWKKNDTI